MFKFSKKSIQILNTVDKRLKTLAEEVLKVSPYDFAITHGLRNLKTQQEYFKNGSSKCDGIIKKSKHQEGKAIDIMCYDENGKGTWEHKYYIEVANVFKKKAIDLNISIRCGVDFKNFFDGPHIELV